MTNVSSKRCVLCNADLVGLPRVKDPKGRYYCPDCYEQGIQRKQKELESRSQGNSLEIDPNDETSAETAVDAIMPPLHEKDASLLDDLVEKNAPPPPTQQITPCENCGQPLPANDILCTSCGYNRRTGEMLTVRTSKRKADWAAESGVFITPGVTGGGFMALFGILFFIGRTVEPVALAFFLTYAIFALAVTLAALFFAFRASLGQGLLTLVLPLYVLWFVFGVHDGPYLKWMYAAMLVASAFAGALIAILGITALPGDFWNDLGLQ